MRHGSLTLALGLLMGLASQPAWAQWRGRAAFPRFRAVAQRAPNHPPPRMPEAREPNPGAEARKGQPNLRGMAGLPPKWVERLRDMPPGEQERFMRNNQQFQNLPPQRQEQIRKNLEKWNKLTPEQKAGLRREEAFLETMSPQQRQYLRNVLLPKWQALPPERRQLINRHLGTLRNMSPATQQAALNDPKFLEGLSPDEQSMLRELNSFRNSPAQ